MYYSKLKGAIGQRIEFRDDATVTNFNGLTDPRGHIFLPSVAVENAVSSEPFELKPLTVREG